MFLTVRHNVGYISKYNNEQNTLRLSAGAVLKAGTHYPYVRAVRTARAGKKALHAMLFCPYVPYVRTGKKALHGVYGTPVYVARNVISI